MNSQASPTPTEVSVDWRTNLTEKPPGPWKSVGDVKKKPPAELEEVSVR